MSASLIHSFACFSLTKHEHQCRHRWFIVSRVSEKQNTNTNVGIAGSQFRGFLRNKTRIPMSASLVHSFAGFWETKHEYQCRHRWFTVSRVSEKQNTNTNVGIAGSQFPVFLRNENTNTNVGITGSQFRVFRRNKTRTPMSASLIHSFACFSLTKHEHQCRHHWFTVSRISEKQNTNTNVGIAGSQFRGFLRNKTRIPMSASLVHSFAGFWETKHEHQCRHRWFTVSRVSEKQNTNTNVGIAGS